ncbi:MAG TPA: transposase [Terriglobia bacterium]|nr:transposase [Terriglobia bacterium]
MVLGWELLAPGEGELTAALRLLERLLPRVRQSLDLILGDALYCCRPFFQTVCGAGLEALAISSGQTEMDEEIELLRETDPPRQVPGLDVAVWEMESEAWRPDLKRPLRVIHCERGYEAPPWKHERQQLRVVTSVPVAILPAGQGWTVGRCRWRIENGTFNRLTRDYALTHNYHHAVAALVALLALRSFACFLTQAYWRYATARSRHPPARFVQWFQQVLIEDWVRYLDAAGRPDRPSG